MTYINFLKKQMNKAVNLNCLKEMCEITEINESDEYAVCKITSVNDKTKEEKIEEIYVKLSDITQLSEGKKKVNHVLKAVGETDGRSSGNK